MQNLPALEIDEEDFNTWKSSFVTQAIFKSLVAHAFDLKIGSLEEYWATEKWEDRDQQFIIKSKAGAKIELIEDLVGMDYETLQSYFKSE